MKQIWQEPKLEIVTMGEDIVTASTVTDKYDWLGWCSEFTAGNGGDAL